MEQELTAESGHFQLYNDLNEDKYIVLLKSKKILWSFLKIKERFTSQNLDKIETAACNAIKWSIFWTTAIFDLCKWRLSVVYISWHRLALF